MSRTGADFDKIGVFYDKCYIYSGKYVYIIIKIKYINFVT